VAATFAAVFGSWLLSAYLFSPTAFADLLRSPPLVVHPPDLWWPLAHLRDPPGVIPAYFLPHALSAHARQLAAAATVPLALPLARRQNRTVADCLALLALGFLTRCLLDPSNHIYYQVPFILAVTAWEARTRGVPLIALTATVYYWLVFHTIAGAFGADVQFACYLGVTVPLAVVLGRPVLGIGGLPGRLRPAIVPGT
jgi:hypothetical protein